MYECKLYHYGKYAYISFRFGTYEEMQKHIEENSKVFPKNEGYEWKCNILQGTLITEI